MKNLHDEVREIALLLGRCEPKWAELHSKQATTEIFQAIERALPKEKTSTKFNGFEGYRHCLHDIKKLLDTEK